MPYKARLEYEVPYADTDQMGVIYYANYLVFFERVRTTLLNDLGYPYRQLEADGVGLPVTSAHVDYKNSAAYGDILSIHGWLESMTAVRIQINCEVYCGERLLACGYTRHGGFDLERRRPTRLPDKFVEVCRQALK